MNPKNNLKILQNLPAAKKKSSKIRSWLNSESAPLK